MALEKTLISRGTTFEGDLFGAEIIVCGCVKGAISASESVYLKKNAVVEGPIQTPKIYFEEGAKYSGRLKLDLESKKMENPESRPFNSAVK